MSRAEAERVGLAVRTFGVDVDQAHLHGGQRVLQLALAGIAAVGLSLVASHSPSAPQ
jgi:hypothetical protein